MHNIDTRKENTTVEHLLRRVQQQLRQQKGQPVEPLPENEYYKQKLESYSNIDIDPDLYFTLDYASRIYDPRTIPGNTRFYKIKKIAMRIFRLYATRQVEFNATILQILNKFFDKFHDIIKEFDYFRKAEVKLLSRIENSEGKQSKFVEQLQLQRQRIERLEGRERVFNRRLTTLEDLENRLQHALTENVSLRQRLDKLMLSGYFAKETDSITSQQSSDNIDTTAVHNDHLYFPYLNEDRGIESIIYERVERYVPFFAKQKKSQDIANPYVIDIGCGRGEFLDACHKADVPCKGLEINEDMVKHCCDKGYEVELGDAISFLNELEDNSTRGIISCHVIEHFPPQKLISFLKLCTMKLAPGGRLVLETPNPTSLFALCSFYKDFTHVHPVHPDTLQFLLKQLGLNDITKLELSPPLNEMLEEPTDDFVMINNIKKLNKIIYGHLDYAIFATKS